jgi:hypothetical protein
MSSNKSFKMLIYLLASLGLVFPAAASPSSAGVQERDRQDVRHSAYLQLATDDSWKWSPAVAYDTAHDRYLTVWETIQVGGHHAIYARLVNSLGQMSGVFEIYNGDNNSLQPAVAYDSAHGRYFVVWAYDSAGDGLDGDIYGRFIPWDGPSAGESAFGVDVSRDNTDKPKLAYSPISDRFLVVWKVEAAPSYIAGGIIKGDKSGFPVAVSSGPEVRDFPDVTYNLSRNEFVVVWDEDVGDGQMDLDVRAIRLDFAGGVMGVGEFAVTTSTSNEQHPTVAACSQADEYFFAWQQQVNQSANENIFGRMMSGTGVLGQSYGVAGTTLPQRYPEVSCNPGGTEFLLAWHDQYAQPLLRWGVWAEVIGTNFAVKPAFQVVAPSGTADRLYPAVAYGNKSALIVWQHSRDVGSFLDIWGQLVWPYTVFLPLLRR